MKYIFLYLVLFLSLPLVAQNPQVQEIKSKENATVSVKGKLDNGVIISDLSWASRSSTACFPATQNSKFTGNHVLFSTDLPPHSVMYITVIPDDKNANFSLYGYQVGAGRSVIVPNLNSCVSCEADYKWDRPHRGRTQDHTRKIRFNAIRNPYTVFIGVVGANGLKTGGFTVKVTLEK